MPCKPSSPCRSPRCPNLSTNGGYCDAHQSLVRQAQRQADKDRGNSTERGYNYRWQVESKLFLNEHPLCEICQKKTPPRVTAATLVDHIIPHKGDQGLFWDKSNWQGSCDKCHNIKTASEDGGFGNKPAEG